MSRHRYTYLDELRESTRFAREKGTDVAVIWHTQGEELLVDVHDESIGGLGVYLADVTGLHVDQELNVVYAGCFMRAYVRHVQPRPEGGYVVGLECERLD